ncbi:hypothetical protein Tco_1025177 [Tanacetum coccineum]
MGSITDIKSVLTLKALNLFCKMLHIPDEVHPQLPTPNQTIHEMPTSKIGVYTRFFEYANFRLPISTFLVNMVRHYRIHISQLSVIAAIKVSHFEILCRVYGFQPMVGLFRYFYINSKNKGWMSFKMDLLAFIRTVDPTKVRIGERQRTKDEPKLLDTTIGRVVPLLLVAHAYALSELEVSVDKLFDEGGSSDQAEQRDSANGGQGVGIQLVSEAAEIVAEDVAPLAIRNAKVRGGVVPTLPFMKSSVFAIPEHEGEDHTDYVTGTTLWTISPPQRFGISSDSSHHSSANVTEAEVDFVVSGVSSSAGGADHTMGGFSKLTGSDFIVSGIRTVISLDTDLQKVYVPQWSITNGSRLDDGCVCRKMVDEFAPLKFFASIRGMEHDQLFIEFNVRASRQMSLSAEVTMHAEYNIKEIRRLKFVVDEQTELLKDEVQALKEFNATIKKEKNDLDVMVADLAALVKVRECEVADLDVLVHELESSSSVLQEKVTVYEGCCGKDLLDILHLEDALTEKFGLGESQPHVDQLMVPIHHSSNKTIIGATALSLALDVSNIRVQKIRDNIANYRSALRDVFIPFAEPLSAMALEGMEGTFDAMTSAATTMALSTTLVSTSTVNPISIDDYEVVEADDQAAVGVNDASFPNIDDVDLHIS